MKCASIRDIGESASDSVSYEPSTRATQPEYGRRVVYLPGDIKGLDQKLHLLAAEFSTGNTTVRNELVHVLDALLRLKQLTRSE